MRAGCINENRCDACPVWHVDRTNRNEVADGIDALVNEGFGVDGAALEIEQIAELAIGEAGETGELSDAGIIAGAMVLIASGKCNKVW